MEIIFRERGGPPPPPDQLQGFRDPDQIVVAETGASGGKGSALEAIVSLLNLGSESPTSPNGGGFTAGPGIEIIGNEIEAHISAQMPNALTVAPDGGMRVVPGGVPDPLLISDGTPGAPSLAFANQPTLGFYRVVADQSMGLDGRLEINMPTGQVPLVLTAPGVLNVVYRAGNGTAAHTYQDGSVARWRIRKGVPAGGSHFEIARVNDSNQTIVSLRISRTTGQLSLPEFGNPPLVVGISTQAGNALVKGSDNMFYVPDPTAPDPTTFISTDAGNVLVAGTDSLLFVPTPAPPTAASLISADADNQLVQGSDNLLLVPETPPQIQGSVATVADLPASGQPGQYWIVEADGNLYGWEP